MARSEARDKALEVRGVVERIRQSLVSAHRRIYRAAVRSQNDIGTGNPSAKMEASTALGKRMHTDSTRDVVVIGFWAPSFKTPKYVCSTSGLNIARAVKKVAFQVLERANSWRAKESAAIFDEFLRDVRLLLQDVQKVDPDSPGRDLEAMHALDMRKMRRTLGVSFAPSEAEARMASYLMHNDVQEVVDLYSTDGPCGPCCRTLAGFEPAKAKLRERLKSIYKNPVAHPGMDSDGRLLPGFAWRLGWAYYGQQYQADQREKCTDFHALDAAVKAESIEGYGAL